MATAKTMYFSGQTPVACIDVMSNKEFRAKFGDRKSIAYDGYRRIVGWEMDGRIAARGEPLPVDRVVHFKRNPSLHKCDARCRHAKGHQCECSCHGKNHGLGS